ncbi:GWxTD domain-containing protein [Hymenobacter jeollabukensis]|uniref:GWxTD domain-containing protein n=1 Tax=Hymenobacter jeollabukensis TaxID=2025313 RepID=A0A5R8WPK1_9BACT|nr:GWxTD domain-containing protein [Hymenobacter jeollabukensis]TLM92224.1 GWxTD domain-containing protein [Hymenobacter jeollabukensis]
MMRPLLLLLCYLGIAGSVSAQKQPVPWRIDFAGLYQPGRPSIDARREGVDSLRLFVRFPAGTAPRADQHLRVMTWSSYEARRPGWQDDLGAFGQTSRGNDVTVSFCVPLAPLAAASVLAVGSVEAIADAPEVTAWLPLTAELRRRPFVLTDSAGRPLLRRYLRTGETVRLDLDAGASAVLTLRRYPHDFSPALPPHTDPARQQTTSRTLTALSVQTLVADQPIRFAEPGLYTLQLGDTPPLGVLVQPGRFPEVATAPELIDPLRYLTTSVEREQLERSEAPKRAVDEFWLRAGGNEQSVARVLIRDFYGRVAEANRLFTAHKPGWMTDRGLLYVVLGPPDRVERTALAERWEYLGTERAGTYTFRPKPSTFAPDYYELVRRPEYEWLWMRAVQQWRTGKNAPAPRAGR